MICLFSKVSSHEPGWAWGELRRSYRYGASGLGAYSHPLYILGRVWRFPVYIPKRSEKNAGQPNAFAFFLDGFRSKFFYDARQYGSMPDVTIAKRPKDKK